MLMTNGQQKQNIRIKSCYRRHYFAQHVSYQNTLRQQLDVDFVVCVHKYKMDKHYIEPNAWHSFVCTHE